MMDPIKFGNLDSATLKKRRRTYNMVSVFGMVLVIGGIGLYTADTEKYRIWLWGSIIFYLVLMYSFRTWAIQIKKELQRREGKL